MEEFTLCNGITGPVSPGEFIMLTGRCPSCDRPLFHEDINGQRMHMCMVYLPDDWQDRLGTYLFFRGEYGKGAKREDR